tara:strand:+ start:48 stop:743 length:696 start_codon:yes stop_codon:yes gene_type:complete
LKSKNNNTPKQPTKNKMSTIQVTTEQHCSEKGKIETKCSFTMGEQVDYTKLSLTERVKNNIKLKHRVLVSAKLFVSMNMEKVETSMEEGNIKENEYIETLDTLMVMDQIIIPKAEADLWMLKSMNKINLTQKDRSLWKNYSRLFEEIWIGRCGSHVEVEGNNLMNINQIAGMFAFAKTFWFGDDEAKKKAPICLSFKAGKEMETMKSCFPKWKRELQQPIAEMMERHSHGQ